MEGTVRYDMGGGGGGGVGGAVDGSMAARWDEAEGWYLYSLAAGRAYRGLADLSSSSSIVDDSGIDNAVPSLTSENAYLGLGQLRLDQSRPSDALRNFDDALRINALNVRAWTCRGLALVDLGRAEEAEVAFETAVKLGDDSETDALNNLALVRSMAGRHREAIDAFKTAIRRATQTPGGAKEEGGVPSRADGRTVAELYTNLGVSLCDVGGYREAVVAFAAAVRADPTFADAAVNLKAVQDAINAGSV